jgi:hypothetical protein
LHHNAAARSTSRSIQHPVATLRKLQHGAGVSINKLRSFLYRAASVLGDVNAARKGKIVQRVVHKTETRVAMKIIRRLFK